MNKAYEFDLEEYREIDQVREVWLKKIISMLPDKTELSTALDLGCGAGYFSGVLKALGFDVTAMDLQEENLRICRKRYPSINFSRIDIDSEAPIGSYDLVLLFGILYHLQSPLQSILRIKNSIRRIAIVETRVAEGNQMACFLFNEKCGPAHNLARVTAVPTFPALIGIFKHAGFDNIYRPIYQPEHDQWSSKKNGQRHNIIVARDPISVVEWPRIQQNEFMKKWEPLK